MHVQKISALINESPMNRGMDGAAWMANPLNIAKSNRHGDVFLFEYDEPGIYQFHWLRMRSKGSKAINRTRAALAEVFRETGAKVIFGLVPDDRRDSKLMARWIGATSHGMVDTEHGPCELFIMTKPVGD